MATKPHIEQRIRELLAMKFCVASNEGTYSASEGHAATGSGDPTINDCNVYEHVDGRRLVIGCAMERAPGRLRSFSPRGLAEARAELAQLRAALRR